MKSVLISIQPYWVFLIIAKYMGWDIPQYKTVEVRKNYPKADDWNKKCQIYCSKNKKSFNQIPKEYQPFMEKFLGKVIGEFMCNNIDFYDYYYEDGVDIDDDTLLETMLERDEINIYAKGKTLYGWHISNLVIYDKPRELREFYKPCQYEDISCFQCHKSGYDDKMHIVCCNTLKRPPQSWCYVESEEKQ